MADKFSPLLFGRKTDEIYQRARSYTRREMETFVDKVQLGKVDEDDDLEVFELFGAKILKGVADELMNYFPADSYRNSIEELAYGVFNESKENNKPSLKEAKERVALIAGQQKMEESQKMEENLESSMIQAAKEGFCILMDWEIKPEDITRCVIIDDLDGIFAIETADGEKFKYNMKDDCIL